jgi:hypothetical protein
MLPVLNSNKVPHLEARFTSTLNTRENSVNVKKSFIAVLCYELIRQIYSNENCDLPCKCITKDLPRKSMILLRWSNQNCTNSCHKNCASTNSFYQVAGHALLKT